MDKSVDSIQESLTTYACALNYDDLPLDVIHAAKVRTIDTLGAAIGGIFGEPCRIVRNLAAQMPDRFGATVIGTRIKTTPDMAAFTNATTARDVGMTDSYHSPGTYQAHPSDVLTPILAVAEHAQVDGREFIASVVLGYEVFCRISDTFYNLGFHHVNFACIGTAVAAGKLLGLSPSQMSHCISMAVVPNNILHQTGTSMFQSVASGYAGRAGVFAALLARAGMEGPHLPFEGKAGWCDHIARERFSLKIMGGGNDVPFKILDTRIKYRPLAGSTIPSILAAEKVGRLNVSDVKQVTVEAYKYTKENAGTGGQRWNPDSREDADHSIPYVVAAALMEGTVTQRSFNDVHLRNPALRAFIRKIDVIENLEFTEAFGRSPVEHRARVTVIMNNGNRLVGDAGDETSEQTTPQDDAQIEEKFCGLTEDVLGTQRVNAILERLWHLEDMKNVAVIPPSFVIA